MTTLSFGISTAPQQVSYAELQRVWLEADEIPQIEHAWLFDHLMPIAGDRDGPVFEGWTMLAALAAQTRRLRLGLAVTSNRFRPPAMLAKIAATVDQISGGRLEFGIGAGSLPTVPVARREYDAYGLPYLSAADAVGRLDESLTVIRRLWEEDQPFDFDGQYVQLKGAFCNPGPVQRPRPPIMIGGRSTGTLRVLVEQGDRWNFNGHDPDDTAKAIARLDRLCAEAGRDPATIVRSMPLPVSYAHPEMTRELVRQAMALGFSHFLLSLPSPYPEGVAAWVTSEIIENIPS